MSDDLRAKVIAAFRKVSGLPVDAVRQIGRDPDAARFVITLDDGGEIRLGGIDNLWSNAQFSKRCLVACGRGVRACKPGDWRDVVQVLVAHATDVQDTPGESFEDAVVEWLREYSQSATADVNGARAGGLPYIDGDELYITAADLRTYLARRHNEQVARRELLGALREIGFQRVTLNYTRRVGRGEKRSTISYYRGALALLDGDDAE